MAENYDWSRFVARIAVNAPAEKLYACWATRTGIEYWFLRLSEYKTPEGLLRNSDEPAQKGDSYTWRWHGWGDAVTEHGTIQKTNGHNLFKFTFAEVCHCTVTIKEEGTYRVVELVQDNIPTDEKGKHNWHLGCKTGWTFYLANMKSLLEGGIDLRNRDEALKNVVNS
jgi:uncharacterized protein YndB with AHSA1/START domain